MEITIGWWLVPLVITVVGHFFVPKAQKHNWGPDLMSMFATLAWMVVSLISWLIWALLK